MGRDLRQLFGRTSKFWKAEVFRFWSFKRSSSVDEFGIGNGSIPARQHRMADRETEVFRSFSRSSSSSFFSFYLLFFSFCSFWVIQTSDSADFGISSWLQFDGDGCVDLSFFVGGIVDMDSSEKWRSCGEEFVSLVRSGGRRGVGSFSRIAVARCLVISHMFPVKDVLLLPLLPPLSLSLSLSLFFLSPTRFNYARVMRFISAFALSTGLT